MPSRTFLTTDGLDGTGCLAGVGRPTRLLDSDLLEEGKRKEELAMSCCVSGRGTGKGFGAVFLIFSYSFAGQSGS